MRIAIDFDGTLCESQYPAIGKATWKHRIMLAWAKHKQNRGDLVILNTCREGILLSAALDWLAFCGFTPDLANENDKCLIGKWGDCRKISADLYVDDHNAGLLGWILRTPWI